MEHPLPQDVVHPSPEPYPAPAPSAACHVDGENGTSDGAAGGCAESPVLVIRGEREGVEASNRAQVAFIDWLAFTVPPGEGRDWQWVIQNLVETLGIGAIEWKRESRKWNGYLNMVELIHPVQGGESVGLGRLGWGGESQRGTIHVALNGQACALVKDWAALKYWGESVGAWITRADTTYDDYQGKALNISVALDWLSQGGFNSNGRPPKRRLDSDLGSGEGSTMKIGDRSQGKYCRIYEKGKELGDRESSWCRAEVEWKAKGQYITWDVLIQPGNYLSAAYPCFIFLSETQSKMQSVRLAASISYEQLVKWVKSAAGKALNTMLKIEDGDAASVLVQVVREGTPKRLEPFIAVDGLLEEVAHADDESP